MLVKKEIKNILSFFLCMCIVTLFSSCGASIGQMKGDEGNLSISDESNSRDKEECEILIIATLEADSLLEDAVRGFNNEQDDIRLVIKQYADFEDENSDYEFSKERFLEDVASGEGFDLVNIPRSLVLEEIDSLEDLQPYIDADSYFSQVEFNENVLNGFRSNGQLLGIPAFYSVAGLVGDGQMFNDEDLIPEKLISLLRENPESGLYRNCTPEKLVSEFLTYGSSYFYDRETGNFNFTDGKMEGVLEVAYMLNSRKNIETYKETSNEAYGNDYLFESYTITEPMDFMFYSGRYGESTTFFGYPSAVGCAPEAVISCTVVGMNRECENKTAAFEFIKSVYKSELSDSDRWGLPTDNVKLREMIEENLKEEFRGETNVYIWDDRQVILDGLTEDEADDLYELANSTVVVRNGSVADELYNRVLKVLPEVLADEIAIDSACEILQGIKESGP